MAKRRNAIAALLALTTTIGISLPSNAQVNFSDIDSLISSWRLPLGAVAPNQTTVRANIDTRATQLETQINSEVTSGRLTVSEAAALRAQLADMRARLNGSLYSGGGLTVGEVRDILTGLRTVAANLTTSINNSDTVIGGGVGIGQNPATISASIEGMRTRIRTARNLGQIDRREANQLNSSLSWIRTELTRLSRNGLTAFEATRLNNHLATVSTRFDSMTVAFGRLDVSSELATMRSRINSGITSGALTRFEARQLLSEIDRLTSLNSRYLMSGRRVNEAEYRQLRSMLADLRIRVNSYM